MATELPGVHLVDSHPEVSATQMLAELVPPREFQGASFENYIPDSKFPSQAAAVAICKASAKPKSFFSKAEPLAGVYLDGGFGVGKTHLLGALWHDHQLTILGRGTPERFRVS